MLTAWCRQRGAVRAGVAAARWAATSRGGSSEMDRCSRASPRWQRPHEPSERGTPTKSGHVTAPPAPPTWSVHTCTLGALGLPEQRLGLPAARSTLSRGAEGIVAVKAN